MIRLGKAIAVLMLALGLVSSAQALRAQELGSREAPKSTQSGDELFVEVELPTRQIYLGESLTLEYVVYVKMQRGRVYYDVEAPNFKHWTYYQYAPDAPKRVIRDGIEYMREPFARYQVLPMRTGHLALPQLKVALPFEDLPKDWVSHQPYTISVIEPPQPYPKDFRLENVGNIRMHLRPVNERPPQIGETLTLELSIESDNPTQKVRPLELNAKDHEGDFILYNRNRISTENTLKDGKFSSRSLLRYRLVPLRAGQLSFPALKLVYFNPSSYSYHRIETPAYHFTVPVSSRPMPDHQLPEISDGSSNWQPRPLMLEVRRETNLFFWGYFLVGPLVLLLAMFYTRLCPCMEQERPKRSRKIKALAANFPSLPDAAAQEKALRLALGPYVKVQGHVNQEELLALGLPEEELAEFIEIYKELQNACYGQNQVLSPEKAQSLMALLKQWQKGER